METSMNAGKKAVIFVVSYLGVTIVGGLVILGLFFKTIVNDVYSNRYQETNFSPYTKWVNSDYSTRIYCMNCKYGGYGYTTINDQEEFFCWTTCTGYNNTCKNDNMVFYFPERDESIRMVETVGVSKNDELTLKPYRVDTIISNNWSEKFYKAEFNNEDIDMRYSFLTKIYCPEFDLKFKINYSEEKNDVGYKMYAYFNNELIEATFTDKTHIKLIMNGSISEGSWSFTKEDYYLKFNKDELFGKEGETLTFKTKVEY